MKLSPCPSIWLNVCISPQLRREEVLFREQGPKVIGFSWGPQMDGWLVAASLGHSKKTSLVSQNNNKASINCMCVCLCACIHVMFFRGWIIILLYTINILTKHIWAGKEELYTFILIGDQMRHMLAKSNEGSGGTSSLWFSVHDFKSSHFS